MAANTTVNIYGTIPYKGLSNSSKSPTPEVYGLSFPLGSKNGNYFAKSSNVEKIKHSIKQLLLTDKGERLMLPNFGCNLKKYLFQPLDEDTFSNIKQDIVTSFSNYISGATLRKISVVPYSDIGPMGGNSLSVTLVVSLNTDLSTMFDVWVVIS